MTDKQTRRDPDELPVTAEPDDLVVYLPHMDVVTRWLEKNGTPVKAVTDTDDRLGLALVKLDAKDPLEPLLARMRTEFEAQQYSWVPLVGKNRHLENVVGMPQPKPHSANEPATATGLPPTATRGAQGRGVRVGIADTKVFDHPDLTGRFVADRSALWHDDGGPTPFRAGHATFVAGLVLRRAPAAELHVVNVLSDDGKGKVWDLAVKLMALADAGLDVLNLSLGCHTEDNKPPLVLRRTIELLSQRMVVVASAGNHGQALTGPVPTWPAALPDVVAVGATNGRGGYAKYSPVAPWVTCTAPGTAISTYLKDPTVALAAGPAPYDGYATWKGTSFAAATVTGAIAAKTVPGKVTAREALATLLADTDSVVSRYVWPS